MERAVTGTEMRKRKATRGTASKGILLMLSEQWVGKALILDPLLSCSYLQFCPSNIVGGPLVKQHFAEIGSNRSMVCITHMA